MTTPIDKVRKLLALALNNSNIEEASAAALMAARLIEQHGFSVGGERVTMPQPEWSQPDSTIIEDIISAANREKAAEASQTQGSPAGSGGLKAHIPDTDLDGDFMRQRVIFAWRSIREQRKVLEREIENYERRTHYKFPRL